MLLTAGTVVTGFEVVSPGWVEVDGERVVAVGHGRPAHPADVHMPDLTVVPGFVDMHVHGGGGGAYTSHDPSEVRRALRYHQHHGTTTSVASLVSADLDTLAVSLRILADLVDDGDLVGVHLEGPWLSRARAGAHNPAHLCHPDHRMVSRLLDLGRGQLRMVTLAPELPGGLAAVHDIAAAGVIVAIGHTDADYDTTVAAIDAGASVATHLFNAMPPLHHRRPGPIVALMDDPRVTVEVIADGVHLHPVLVSVVRRAVGVDRVALVTDAMAAAGMPDGEYRLGGLTVDVLCGIARDRETQAIAGSTATMDQMFRVAVGQRYADPAALIRAVTMTAVNPARALGLADVGRLAPGCRADLVALDSQCRVRGVLRRGRWVTAP